MSGLVIWYRNSVLASVISIFGCIITMMGIAAVRDGEGAGGALLLAVGIGMAVLGKWISSRKGKKHADISEQVLNKYEGRGQR